MDSVKIDDVCRNVSIKGVLCDKYCWFRGASGTGKTYVFDLLDMAHKLSDRLVRFIGYKDNETAVWAAVDNKIRVIAIDEEILRTLSSKAWDMLMASDSILCFISKDLDNVPSVVRNLSRKYYVKKEDDFNFKITRSRNENLFRGSR